MYGLVNEGIRELVLSKADAESWAAMCEKVGIDAEGFEPLCPYDDSITYKLIDLVAKKFKIPQEEALRQYGQFWITYTATQGYGEIMKLFGTDFRTSLSNLNRMHAHMGAMMPKLLPPRFQVEASDSKHLTVHYYSHREGLAPMVIGLLEGLAIKYGDSISVKHIPKGTRSDHDEFEVSCNTI